MSVSPCVPVIPSTDPSAFSALAAHAMEVSSLLVLLLLLSCDGAHG